MTANDHQLCQTELPFLDAEMSRGDRKNMLANAMRLIKNLDASESRILELIFNMTDGGKRGELKKSYEELGSTPWCGCCSISKARSAIRKFRKYGVINVQENIYASNGQCANSYTINWPGIRTLLGYSPLSVSPVEPVRVSPQNTPMSCENRGVSCENRGVSPQDSPYKEYSLFPSLIQLSSQPASQPAVEVLTGPAPGESPTIQDTRPADRVGGEIPAVAPDVATPPAWSPQDLLRVDHSLHAAGYDRRTARRKSLEAEAAGLAVDDVLAIIADFRANRAKFRGLGALGYRLSEGSWPVDGVVPVAAAAAQQRGVVDQRTTRDDERRFYLLVKESRAAGLGPDQIRARLRAALPPEFCAARGW